MARTKKIVEPVEPTELEPTVASEVIEAEPVSAEVAQDIVNEVHEDVPEDAAVSIPEKVKDATPEIITEPEAIAPDMPIVKTRRKDYPICPYCSRRTTNMATHLCYCSNSTNK